MQGAKPTLGTFKAEFRVASAVVCLSAHIHENIEGSGLTMKIEHHVRGKYYYIVFDNLTDRSSSHHVCKPLTCYRPRSLVCSVVEPKIVEPKLEQDRTEFE